MFGVDVSVISKLRVLGVRLDWHLSFDGYITSVVQACNYYIRVLCHICPFTNRETGNTMACSILCITLDYCNSVPYGITELNIFHLQRVQNAWTRVASTALYRAPSSSLQKSLHWLSIRQRVIYKIVMLTFKVPFHGQPVYLADLIVDHTSSRTVRSSK